MRRRPRWRIDAGISAAAGSAAAIGSAASAFSQKRRSLFMNGFKIGANCPHGLLAQCVFNRGHVDATIANRALTNALHEDFVAFVAPRQVAQLGSDPAGASFQALAT